MLKVGAFSHQDSEQDKDVFSQHFIQQDAGRSSQWKMAKKRKQDIQYYQKGRNKTVPIHRLIWVHIKA